MAKKNLGALLADTTTEPQAGFTLEKGKHFSAAIYAGKCMASGAHDVPIGAAFVWYATGIITCLPCWKAGKLPDEKAIAAKLLAQALKGKPKKAWHSSNIIAESKPAPMTVAQVADALGGVVEPKTKGEAKKAFASLTSAVIGVTGEDEDEDDAPKAKTKLAAFVETQKVRGLRMLDKLGCFLVPAFAIMPGEEEKASNIITSLESAGKRAFARPCPIVPKHGFVDSRPVDTFEEACEVFEEARDIDAQAQLIVMPCLEGVTSAVLTPNTLGIGAGNDSVTGAKGSYTLPVSVAFPQAWLDKAGVPADGAPYLEIVDQFAVQLRAGDMPPNAKCLDYVTKTITVTNVVKVNAETHHDLVAFDELSNEWGAMWEAGDENAPVIWHENGSPVSHYAVHMRTKSQVPYLITREPIIGETLTPTAIVCDVEQHRAAFLDGAASDLRTIGEDKRAIAGTLAASILAIHQAADMLDTEDGARLIGASCVGLFYATMAACHGETRHCSKIKAKGLQRHVIYEGAWADPLDARRTLPNALALFSDGALWSHSYGGPKWAAATEAALELWDSLVDVGRNGGKIADVIASAHKLVNMAHNTGWLLNKFLTQAYFDQCANARPEAFVHCVDSNSNTHAVTGILYRMLANAARLPLDWSKMRQGRWKHSKDRLKKAKAEKAVAALENPPLLVKAQANVAGSAIHIQYQFAGEHYAKVDVVPDASEMQAFKRAMTKPDCTSMAGTSATPYKSLTFEPVPGSKVEWVVNNVTGNKLATVFFTGGAA